MYLEVVGGCFGENSSNAATPAPTASNIQTSLKRQQRVGSKSNTRKKMNQNNATNASVDLESKTNIIKINANPNPSTEEAQLT